jgi:hypothetical protein
MSTLTTNKVLALLAMFFVAGAAAGSVATHLRTRHQEVSPASVEKVCTRFQDRLKTRLSLSDEQMKKLQPVFDQTAGQLQAARARAIRETDEVICRAHERIALELSSGQKDKLAQMDQERRDWIRHRLESHALAKDP